MNAPSRVRTCVIALLIGCLLAIGAVTVRHGRREFAARKALATGLEAFEDRNWQVASTQLKEYLSEAPDDAAIVEKCLLANLSPRPLKRKNILAAMKLCRRLIRLTGDKSLYRTLEMLTASMGRYNELAYACREDLARFGPDAETTVYLAGALIARQRAESDSQAQRILVRLVEQLESSQSTIPQHAYACKLLGELAMRRWSDAELDRASATRAWLDRAVNHNPDSAEALASRAAFVREHWAQLGLSRRQMLAEVHRDLQRVGDCEPDNPLTLLVIAEQWRHLGMFARAEAALQRAPDLDQDMIDKHFIDPTDWQAMLLMCKGALVLEASQASQCELTAGQMLAWASDDRKKMAVLPTVIALYSAAGNHAAAARCLDECESIASMLWESPIAPPEIVYLGSLVKRSGGDFGRMVEILKPATVTYASEAKLWALLAEAYGQSNRIDLAVSAMKEYLRLLPGDLAMTLELMRLHAGRAEWSLACDLARRAQLLTPDDINIQLDVAHLSYRSGSPARALEIYSRILTGDPTNVRALNDRAWVLSSTGNERPQAIELVGRGIVLEPSNRHLLHTRRTILSGMPAGF